MLGQLRQRGLAVWEYLSPASYRRARSMVRNGRAPAQPAALPAYGSVMTVDGIRMRVDERMSPFQVRKLASGAHTRHERQLILGVLEPDDVVMELGGGIGMLAIACALKVGSDRVFSYEANPFLEPLIRDNYALNSVSPQLKMCVLGQSAGVRAFHLSPHFSRSSLFPTDRQLETHEAPVEPLNRELERIRPSVLIIDIQGGEEELLGFANLASVRKLLVEVHPDILGIRRVNALRRRLRKAGFRESQRAVNSFLYFRDRPVGEHGPAGA